MANALFHAGNFSKPPAELVKQLRELSSCSCMDACHSLTLAEGDLAVAIGVLKYRDCAVMIRGSREEWVMERARAYAKEHPIEEFDFHLNLSENDHWNLESAILRWMTKFSGVALLYYRSSQVPMLREGKVAGTPTKVVEFKRWLVEDQKVTLL